MFEEERYQASKLSFRAGGQAIKGTITGISSSLLTMATTTAGVSLPGLITFGVVGTLGITLGSLLNKRIIDLEHDREEHRILGFYSKEIAAQIGHSVDKLSIADLHNAAKNNETLAQALSINDKKVQSSMRSWLIGAVFATMVVGALFVPGIFGAAAVLGALLPTGSGLAVLAGSAAIKGLFGALTFNITRPIADAIAAKFSGTSRHTTHDYIKELRHMREQGMSLLPQQVLGVFIKANPQLESAIEEQYGRSFDAIIKYNDQSVIANIRAELQDRFQLDKVTSDINSGRISVSELAYLAQGQKSGVEPIEPDTRSTKQKLQEGIELAKQKVSDVSLMAQEKIHYATDHVSQAWQNGKNQVAEKLGLQHAASPVSSSYVERTGGNKASDGTFVAQEEKRRTGSLKPQLGGIG